MSFSKTSPGLPAATRLHAPLHFQDPSGQLEETNDVCHFVYLPKRGFAVCCVDRNQRFAATRELDA